MTLLMGIGLAGAIVFLVAGDFYLKEASAEMKSTSPAEFGGIKGLLNPAQLIRFIRQANIFNWKFNLSIAFLAVYFAAYMLALHSGNVTVVVPLMSMTNVINTFLGKYVLHEQVTLLRWSGLGLIMFGIVLMMLFGSSGRS